MSHTQSRAGKWLYTGAVAALLASSSLYAQKKIPAFEMSSLDKQYTPCQDFDNYANGGWKKNNPIPGTESRWGAFNVLDKENKEVRLKGIINDISQKTNLVQGTEEQQIADFYKSYLDVNTIEQRGLSPLNPFLAQIKSIQSLDDWWKACANLSRIGISSVFGVGVEADSRNSVINALYGGQDGLSLGEKSYYERTDESTQKVRAEFVQHVNKMFAMADWKAANIGQSILDFETKLAKLQLTNVQLRDPVATYNKVSIAEMDALAPQLDWNSYLDISGFKTDSIILQNKPYLTEVAKLVAGTDLDLLKNYLRWQVLTRFAGVLPGKFDKEDFHFFSTVMRGTKQQKNRVERAIRATDGSLGMPLGKLFVKQYFPESSKQKVSEMIENVRTVYGERIDKLTWMSEETKKEAHKKLAAFTYKIGYPDKWKDYSSIKISPDKLLENIVNTAMYRHGEAIKKLGQPVDKSEWMMTPQTVNAYYNPLNNEVVFPAGILQPPFFNANADDAINYGGIIAVIGHEFTHGFDDQGSQFDAEGNLRNWWTESDRKNFEALAKKYIDYFSSIEVLPGFKINGALTIGENIADLGGLTLAYHALEKSLEGKPAPKLIDGFTWQQRFFLGWAQVWHANITDAALRNQIQTDPHSPARSRINGPLPHLVEFQEAWGCKAGDKMVLPASERVVIW
ncbi:endothelin-converting protein [Chitinophaga caeni]|uniref:Endothelin-converting protein n=1 Tax=Chitinophaga caeni TaxID=2029983 RepID=A0A291QQD7_9BACT|nr:M13 family metallopeptidase [Chitinophaga caeni]ATL46092.1 endothelin-converting protein [Chitinophaga caeni]